MTKFTETQQWKSGEEIAAYLDEQLRRQGFTIRPTTPHEERVLCLGDRHYQRGSESYFIEYKSGVQTFYTGNVFLETVSVDTDNKLGWVYTCQADFIFYAAILNRRVLMIKPAVLREKIDYLKTQFREVKTSKGQNATYCTHGLIVPLDYVERNLCFRVVHMQDGAQS